MNNTFAEIKLKNLIYNYNAIKKKSKVKVMAVVKADAYGHGMLQCVKALSELKNKPNYYGVALLSEAIELRKSKIIKDPILCFAPFQKSEIENYINHKILPTISTPDQITELLKIQFSKPFRFQINVNTGMNRLGINYKIAFKEILRISKNKNLIIDGIYTHFATSDEKNKDFANLQLKRFKSVIDKLKENNVEFGLTHAANSGAILDMPDSYFDMVRPGISLYGYYPSQETSESIKLKPVMSIYSKLSTIYEVEKCESVGYGRHFYAPENIMCATIPIGYADGILRGLSNKMNVIINNKVYDQIGRVSMDRISINLGNDKLKKGTKVILIGKSKDFQINAWDWSNILNTIPYEITCTISTRVTRKYI